MFQPLASALALLVRLISNTDTPTTKITVKMSMNALVRMNDMNLFTAKIAAIINTNNISLFM